MPVNPTTAWLTPALRNINSPLVAPMVIAGTPRRLYEELIRLLDQIETGLTAFSFSVTFSICFIGCAVTSWKRISNWCSTSQKALSTSR